MRNGRWPARCKQFALTLLTRSGLPALTRHLSRGRTTIFMLHRFAEPGSGRRGHDPGSLRRDLAYLRKAGYEILTIEEAVRRHSEGGGPSRNAVCFTVDDGYEDFATLAAPVFSAYDCPVTVFLTTGFLDGDTWLWWDRLEHAFATTSHESLELESWHGDGSTVFEWRRGAPRQRALECIVEHCKTVSESHKWELIDEVADRLEVDLPERPPPEYRPLTWGQVRALGRTGLIRFGPHTVTHPILSQAPDDQARREILDSRVRVESETAATAPVFCYPNGDSLSFGAREVDILAEHGFLGAVTSVPGYVADRHLMGPLAAYTLPRFPYPGDGSRFIEAVSGMRRFRPGFEEAAVALSERQLSRAGANQ